jgi:hypothetical protein
MNNIDSASHHRYNADLACPHCQGVAEHESWCANKDPKVSYAFAIVRESAKLTLADSLILHSLGVTWADSRS